MEAILTDRPKSSASAIKLDQSHWPLLIVITPPKVDDEELEHFLEQYSATIKSRGERYALVLDVSNTEKLNPVQRKKLVNMMERNKAFNEKHCAGCAMVFSSMLLKGILTAIFWIHKPPHPTKVFNVQEDAIEWAFDMI